MKNFMMGLQFFETRSQGWMMAHLVKCLSFKYENLIPQSHIPIKSQV